MNKWKTLVYKKIIQGLRKYNLQKRTVWITVLSTVIPIMIIGTGAFVSARLIYQRNNYTSIQKSVDLYRMIVDQKLIQFEQIGNEIASNLGTINIVSTINRQDNKYYILVSRQNQYLNNLISQYMVTIEIVSNSGGILFQPYQFTDFIIEDSRYNQLAIDSPYRSLWFGACHAENFDSYSRVPESMSQNVLMLSTKIRGKTGEYVGLVNIIISSNMLDDILQMARKYDSDPASPLNISSFSVIDEQNRIISSIDNSKLGTTISGELAQAITNDGVGTYKNPETGNKTMVFHANSQQSGFRVVILMNYDEFYASISRLQWLILMLIMICETFSIIISILYATSIRRPILKIVKAMKDLENNMLDVQIDDNGKDELKYLSDCFNEMTSKIRDLIENLISSEKRKREAEIRVLEEQINPHFLYNTLDMINWMAYQAKTPNICRMIEALSNLFRLSLNSGSRVYRVEDELKHVESYLEIQRERFQSGRDFGFHIAADEHVRKCQTIKLILQPLVENALVHGFKNRRGSRNILITVKILNDSVVFTVEDDGIGLGKPTLDADDYHKGFGLYNVSDRLSQYYGEKARLIVAERVDGGVCATIIIPVILVSEENGIDENHDR